MHDLLHDRHRFKFMGNILPIGSYYLPLLYLYDQAIPKASRDLHINNPEKRVQQFGRLWVTKDIWDRIEAEATAIFASGNRATWVVFFVYKDEGWISTEENLSDDKLYLLQHIGSSVYPRLSDLLLLRIYRATERSDRLDILNNKSTPLYGLGHFSHLQHLLGMPIMQTERIETSQVEMTHLHFLILINSIFIPTTSRYINW